MSILMHVVQDDLVDLIIGMSQMTRYLINIFTSKPNLFIQKLNRVKKNRHILRDDSVLFGQSVDAVVRLSHTTNLTANGVSLEGTCHSAGGFVNINDVHLNRSVIFGSDDTVASRAEIVIEFQNCPFLKNN